ncbi:MAG: polysaccharide export protein [Blastocatellia bacterium]|nr:polysaccharide export protein [Blastocatellia bacterium]MCS7156519.1 polysaccharide export protein [Blastocatellia bacterium]MCX7751740.1 polysaccharide export protein [Blastocatellia bacterium]MDW8168841.1 polysaccharide biosynthesis/export family protein [Acidobacteriota bacterium]MDW8257445.1 polysaccharide biosynthesis/export family protein [Acidobacteriota bacterium]
MGILNLAIIFGLCGSVLVEGTQAPSARPPAPAVQEGQQGAPPMLSWPDEEEEYVIGPEDVLEIRVFEQPDLSGEVRVSLKGYIRILPFPEPIKAAGYTEHQLAEIIREKLMALFKNPQVVVRVKESRSRFVAVIGAVRKPDRYEVVRGMRLLNLLAAAGGVTENAGNMVHIIRTGKRPVRSAEAERPSSENEVEPQLEIVDLRQLLSGQWDLVNTRVYPGDIVSVPEADQIFVTGNVVSPNAFRIRGDMTLTKAIALAGGLRPHSQKNKVTILRHVPGRGERVEIVVDLDKVERDQVKDVPLEPNDIVFVPSSSMRNVGMAMLNAFSLGAASQLIWLLR